MSGHMIKPTIIFSKAYSELLIRFIAHQNIDSQLFSKIKFPAMAFNSSAVSSQDAFMNEINQAFTSERLIYVKADGKNQELREFLYQTQNVPAVQSFASSTMLKPNGDKDIDGIVESLEKCLLTVAICLPPNGEAIDDNATPRTSGLGKKPTIIGVLLLGYGGTPPGAVPNRRTSIGITLSDKYHNKGYGREAMNWGLDWAFRHAGLHTVCLSVASYNERAIHLYESLGFVNEGRLREAKWFNRKWYDLLLYSMTEGEWEKLRGISE